MSEDMTVSPDQPVVRLTASQLEALVAAVVRRVLAVCLATFLIASALALFIAAPLEAPANPEVTPNPAKAPWYFLWLQELVTDTTIRIGSL